MHLRFLLLTCFVAALCASPARAIDIPVTCTLSEDGNVSLAIYDAQGKQVRALLCAQPQAKGQITVPWDGLDEKGRPVPAGTYGWKLLQTQGLHAEYIVTLGTNPSPASDTWPGNHGGASAVAVDDTGMYVAGGCGEGNPLVIKQTPAGKRQWGVDHWLDAWMGGYSMASTGGEVYMLQQNGVIQRFNAATGERDARWDIIWESADREKGEDTHLTMDLAARGDQLVAAYANHNAIRWIDRTDGSVLDEAPVPEPLGVAIAPSGEVLVVSKGSILTLTRAQKTPKQLIAGLVSPWRLDVEAASGDILVAERGTTQVVKRFSNQGKLLNTYGIPGGRPRVGRYDPTGFADIDDIASDGHGGFIIVEAWAAPRRVAHFGPDGGLIREWYGGQQYANQGAADPADPRFVWIESHWSSLIQCQVDYEKKTWQVHATYNYGTQAQGMVRAHHHGHSPWKVLHRDGQTLLARESGFPSILRVDEDNRRLVPVMSAFIVGRPDLPIVKEAFARPDAKAPGANIVLWTDRNADGAATADEITGVVSKEIWGDGHSAYDPKDFTFYTPRVNTWGDHTGVSVIKVQEWLPGGIPVYGFGDKITYFQNYPDDFTEMQTKGVAMAKDGFLFGAFHSNVFKPIGVSGFGTTGGNHVIRFTKDGKIAWITGRVAPGSVAAPGEAKTFYSIDTAHNCAIVSDYADSMIHVWDEDGLFVGRLLENPDLDAAPRTAYRLCSENFGNAVFEVPEGMKAPGLEPGDVLLIGGGQNNTPIFRITGWDAFARQEGSVRLAAEQAAQLTARIRKERQRPGLAHVPYLRKNSVKIDGRLDEWTDVTPLEIMDGQDVRAKVYLGWDNTGLYAAFDLTTATPWEHAATSKELAFQGGAAVDVNYGPLGPVRDTAGAGDVRVVAAPLGGTTTAVEFMPVLPPGMDAAQRSPATYRTGQGEVTFARVAPLADGSAATTTKAPALPGADGADEPDAGYVVEIRFPARGLALRPGLRFRLDASVILADEQGRHSAVRLPWHSRAAGDMTVNDTYHEALLRPGNWGEAILER